MRIIGGQYKGFRFDPPGKINARPTTDRAKESLINILLSNYGVENKACLDLFSGTGNIAYELASQGAESITAIDSSFHSVEYIKKNFQDLGFKDHKVIKADVFKWLTQPHNLSFDIIFADPPYDHISMRSLPGLIFDGKILADGGVLVIEHRSSLMFDHPAYKYHRDYGQSRFSFFG